MSGYYMDSKKAKTTPKQEEQSQQQPSLIISQVLEFAMATTQKDQHEIDSALESVRAQLNQLRADIKAAPALESLKETQELEFAVLEEQLKMKAALIDRYKSHNFDNAHALAKEMNL